MSVVRLGRPAKVDIDLDAVPREVTERDAEIHRSLVSTETHPRAGGAHRRASADVRAPAPGAGRALAPGVRAAPARAHRISKLFPRGEEELTVVTEEAGRAVEAVHVWGAAVAKPLYTSKGRGMVRVTADEDVEGALLRFRDAGNHVLYLQKWMPLPGRDLGIAFLGGEYLATYARTGPRGSWLTSVHQGGRYEAREPSPELVELARRAQEPFGLDFTCVDVAEAEKGPVVWEVSAFGGCRGLQEANGIDAAELYVRYVLERIA